jgi:hypothetical protein
MKGTGPSPAFFFLSSLLILSFLVAMPGIQGDVYSDVLIENDEYWFMEMEQPSEAVGVWDYLFWIKERDNNTFDLYVREAQEFEKYKENRSFKAELSLENIVYHEPIEFEMHHDDPDHFIVVDNRNNSNSQDAYSNRTIFVEIDIEPYEKDDEVNGICFLMVCSSCFFIGLIILILIIVAIRDMMGLRKPYKAFPPLKNPPLELASRPGRRSDKRGNEGIEKLKER